MKKSVTLTIAGIAVLLVGIVAATWWFLQDARETTYKAPQNVAYVDIAAEGFVPRTLQVTKGTKVVWVNRDAVPHQVASDPYPDRSALPALFSEKPLAAEGTYSFTFDKVGEWAYHDYLHPELSATIQVK